MDGLRWEGDFPGSCKDPEWEQVGGWLAVRWSPKWYCAAQHDMCNHLGPSAILAFAHIVAHPRLNTLPWVCACGLIVIAFRHLYWPGGRLARRSLRPTVGKVLVALALSAPLWVFGLPFALIDWWVLEFLFFYGIVCWLGRVLRRGREAAGT